MRRAPLLLWLVGAAIVAAIVGGLMVVGGPEEARRKRMDERRLIDLANIADEIAVHFGANDGTLPDRLSDAPPLAWNKARRTDPESGRPYEYARLEENRFELCATFAHAWPEDLWRREPNPGGFATRVEVKIRGQGRGCVIYIPNPDIVRLPPPAPPQPARP